MKHLFLMLIISATLFSSCKKTDKNKCTKNTATVAIQNNSDEMLTVYINSVSKGYCEPYTTRYYEVDAGSVTVKVSETNFVITPDEHTWNEYVKPCDYIEFPVYN
jgi:hypothetical protein